MPSRLKRFHESGQTHFITFGCWHRKQHFRTPETARVFEAALERVRRDYQLCVYGYVVMPDHMHLLISEPQRQTLADAVKSLKQGVSRRLIGDDPHFWQKRYYDFNIRDYRQFVEKLGYIHRNPVKRNLCARPEDWEWSSFRHYATGCKGSVEIESEWTARDREREAGRLAPAICNPTQAKKLEWATYYLDLWPLLAKFVKHQCKRLLSTPDVDLPLGATPLWLPFLLAFLRLQEWLCSFLSHHLCMHRRLHLLVCCPAPIPIRLR